MKAKVMADRELRRVLVLLGLLISVISSAAAGKTHYNEFSVVLAPYTRMCQAKDILTINGQFPGPTLHVNKGDTMIINLHNRSPYNITLHWHGLKQPRNPWSDGAEYITQCGIPPGNSFNYTLIFSTEEGTIWYHAHSDWSRATVHGAIVVYPESGSTYPFPKPDEEVILVIGEWWKREMMAVMNRALETGAEFDLSDGFTINGQPGDSYECSNQSTYRLRVEQGKTYLLRIINAAMSDGHFFSIANHTLTLVGREGAYVKPFNSSIIFISPGQTMDFLLQPNQSPQNLYYMAARLHSTGRKGTFDNTTSLAILEYQDFNSSSQTLPILPSLPSFSNTTAAYDFTKNIRSLATEAYPIDVPTEIDRRLVMVVSMNEFFCTTNETCLGPANGRFASSMNNMSFQEPTMDILQAYYMNISGVYTNDFPNYPLQMYNFTTDDFSSTWIVPRKGTKVVGFSYNESVEVVFQGTGILAGENHPIHLHGHNMYLVATGSGNFDPENDPSTYNLVDPPLLNTVGVPYEGWAAVRFTTKNPGVWLLHCHLARHLSWGMATAFVVKNGPTAETSIRPRPSDMPNFCPAQLHYEI